MEFHRISFGFQWKHSISVTKQIYSFLGPLAHIAESKRSVQTMRLHIKADKSTSNFISLVKNEVKIFKSQTRVKKVFF